MKKDIISKGFLAIGLCAVGVLLLTKITEFNSPENVQKILEEKGFTQVEVKGYNWWCPKGVTIRRHFEAIDSAGVAVEGKICEGSIKSIFDTLSTKPKFK